MLNLVSILSKIPLLSIYLKKPNKIFIVSYYVVLILCIIIIQKDKLAEMLHIWRIKSGKVPIKQYIRVKFKKNNDFKRIVLIVILNIVIIFQSFVQDNFLKNGVEIYFLDVGQGDSTIIRTAKNNGYYPIQWNLDTLDYTGYNSMYCGKNGSTGSYNWWLASPSANSSSYVYDRL